ncbi:MAG: response regulator [Desulfobacterales bacterium]|nr:response regulator [Desulfobacterales bacterium]
MISSVAETLTGRILIADDDPAIRSLFKRAMEAAGHDCVEARDAAQALEELARGNYDVVVTDINMPRMTGLELAVKVLDQSDSDIIVITGEAQDYHYDEIITIGASDFVAKPFSVNEIILRVQRVLRERALKAQTRKSHQELKQAYIDSIHRLVMAAEFKDEETGDHIIRIGAYASAMARKLGMDDSYGENIQYAAPMHDVGKIGIPDRILLKPGKLNNEEWTVMKRHTLIGAQLLSNSKSKILQMAEEIALTHHERFNGKGYPHGKAGEAIPLCGRIVAIADTFDALTSKRPYKAPYPPEIVYDILKRQRGEHFDPQVTDLFLKNFDQFLAIREASGPIQAIGMEDFQLSERDKIRIRT